MGRFGIGTNAGIFSHVRVNLSGGVLPEPFAEGMERCLCDTCEESDNVDLFFGARRDRDACAIASRTSNRCACDRKSSIYILPRCAPFVECEWDRCSILHVQPQQKEKIPWPRKLKRNRVRKRRSKLTDPRLSSAGGDSLPPAETGGGADSRLTAVSVTQTRALIH